MGRSNSSKSYIPPIAIPRTTQGSAECPAETSMLIGFVRPFFHVERSLFILPSEDLWTSHIKINMYAFRKGLTIQLLAEKPRMMALEEKTKVARYFGRRYTASRYTFSPPERGNMEPSSSHIKSPQNEKKKPATQKIKEAPTDPTELRIVDGVEKIPVPIIRPMLETSSMRKGFKITRRSGLHEHCAAKYAQMAPHPTGRI